MWVAHIEYTDGAYVRCYASAPREGQEREWKSGDPVKDWADLRAGLSHVDVICSSDVDHFVFEVPGYRWSEDDGMLDVDPTARRTDPSRPGRG